MSIFLDSVHIYCDYDNCDNKTELCSENLGSFDVCNISEYDSIPSAVGDFALMVGWYIDPITNKVSCPTHDN